MDIRGFTRLASAKVDLLCTVALGAFECPVGFSTPPGLPDLGFGCLPPWAPTCGRRRHPPALRRPLLTFPLSGTGPNAIRVRCVDLKMKSFKVGTGQAHDRWVGAR